MLLRTRTRSMLNELSVCAPAGTATANSPKINATESAPPKLRINFMCSPFFSSNVAKDDDGSSAQCRAQKQAGAGRIVQLQRFDPPGQELVSLILTYSHLGTTVSYDCYRDDRSRTAGGRS